ncbi:MAG: ABC transporter transmembrane domain-containing protein [Desulfobacterales bacterium]|nr:ABC transporter transmembrane domain-containing protein [Desulfobacterales bacterium]
MTHERLFLIKPYFVANRVSILLGLLFPTLVDVMQLFIPRVISAATIAPTAGRADHEGLLHYALAILVIALVIAGVPIPWRRFLIGTSRVIEEGLRNQLFSHIQTLSAGHFMQTRTGDLMAHATNDINHIRMAAGMGLLAP